MDDLDAVRGLSPRPAPPPEDSVSLSTSSTDTINLEDGHYSALRAELEADARDLEGESWSVAVDQQHINSLHQDAVKRQDVIYELIQTEVHHVRTLKLLLSVYQYELRHSLHMEDTRLERMFPQIDSLLHIHQHFLWCLRDEGCLPDDHESYGVFCSHHTDAVSLYKEQLQNNKKFQNLIMKIGRLSIVRRLGVPECILLVTQRITKYPVLFHKFHFDPLTSLSVEEHSALVQALVLIKETISAVDSQVHDYERASRLREIGGRLEPRSHGRWKDGRVFTREDLAEGLRTLLHEGTVNCRVANGRLKGDIHAVLLSDVLLLLQKEKDQKLIFANVDNKTSVISLQMLIVREMAHEDKAMFLISASSSMPEMYEIHTSSREDCNAWMSLIRDAVNSCPVMEEICVFSERLYVKDSQIMQSLTEKLQMFADMVEAVTGMEDVAAHSCLLLRGDASDLQQGRHCSREPSLRVGIPQMSISMGTSTVHYSICSHPYVEGRPQRSKSDPQLQDLDQSESLELSVSDRLSQSPRKCALVFSSERKGGAIVSQQDSHIELQRASHLVRERPARNRGNMLLEQEKQRNLEKQREEVANFHKLQTQHRQNQARWEKERERHRLQAEVLEAELRQREEECRRLEKKLEMEREELERQRETYQQDLERLRESMRTVEKQKEHLNTQMKQNKTVTNPGSFNFKAQQVGIMMLPPPCFTVELVPPRRESISPGPPKPEFPIHLISTTNQVVHKPGAVQQQIPTKLAVLGNKGKEKSSKKRSHHKRNHSAGKNSAQTRLRTEHGSGHNRTEHGSGHNRTEHGSGHNRTEHGSGHNRTEPGSGHNRTEPEHSGQKPSRTRLRSEPSRTRLRSEPGSGQNRVEHGSGQNRVEHGSGQNRVEHGSGQNRVEHGSGQNRVEHGSGQNRGQNTAQVRTEQNTAQVRTEHGSGENRTRRR
uniref:Rho/rac guanine nucleotide exchange factor (GEF) 18a n=1 Tax=Oncorhynchus tshawytscha TaxID=74940 RepID=A0A8C8HVI5_ONCTS